MSIRYRAVSLLFPVLLSVSCAPAPAIQTLYNAPNDPVPVSVSGRQYRVERYTIQGGRREITALNNRGERVILADVNSNDRLMPAEGDVLEEIRYGAALRCEGDRRAIQRRPVAGPRALVRQYDDTVHDVANPGPLTPEMLQRCAGVMAGYDRDFAPLRQGLERALVRR